MSVVAAVAAVVGTVSSVASSRKQAKASKTQREGEEAARRVENATSRLANQREIRKRIAAQRIEQGNLEASAESSGVAGSSSLFGAVGGSQASAAGDIGFARARFSGSAGAAGIRGDAASSASRSLESAQQFGTIAGVSGLFSNAKNNVAIGKLIT